MHPAGVRSEDCKSLSWPETVVLVPTGNVWVMLAHVGSQISNVELEVNAVTLLLQVLLEDASPLGAGNVLFEVLNSRLVVRFSVQFVDNSDV